MLQSMDMPVGAADQMAAERSRTAIANSPACLTLVVGQRPSRCEVVEVRLEDLLQGHGHAPILAEILQGL